jgi:hypothetical protein
LVTGIGYRLFETARMLLTEARHPEGSNHE